MTLHLVAAAALIFFTPIRQILMEQAPIRQASSEPSMSTRQLNEVAEKLDEITENHIERNLEAMQELLDLMQEINNEEFAEYIIFEHSQIKHTPEDVNSSLEQALAAMQQARDLIETQDHTTAITQQALAMSHQNAITQRLELVQASSEVRKSQQEAEAVQKKASEENERADTAIKEIEEIDQRLKYPEGQIITLKERVPQYQQSVNDAEKKLSEAKTSLDQMRQNLEQLKSEQDQEMKAVQRAETQVTRAEEAVAREERNVGAKQADQQRHQDRLNEFQKQVTELHNSRKEKQQIADISHQAAQSQQAEAIRLQTDVAEKIKQDVAERVAALMAELKPDETVQEELSVTAEVPQTTEMNALELYDAARMAEQQLTEKYRQGRAMRLSMLQDVPFSAALDAVDRVAPVRPDLPADVLTRTTRNDTQLDEKKEAVRTALAETSSMVALGNALVSQAFMERNNIDMSGNGGGRISLAAIRARSARTQELEKLADQETSGKAVDLANAMQKAAAGGDGSNDSESEKGQQYTENSRVKTISDEQPPLITTSIRPVAGRKVSDEGDGAEWMAVTQWYMLGPFANPGRANIDRVFPPESFIDLNAVYGGKDGRTIEWKFSQTNQELGRVVPTNDEPYGIWYAFTELQFDRECDLWITMGSDDKGRVWINDNLVWVSESQHKNWKPDEAQRRVHFRKGRNKILYRVENGQHATAFSLWVHLSNAGQ